MPAHQRKYATATASGTHIGIPMPKAGSPDFATGSDWTPATGDVKVSLDGGAQANITTLPSYSNGQWVFQLSAAETTAKSVRVAIVDAAAKAVDDNFFTIETYGHASAMIPVNFGDAVRMGLTALPNAAPGAADGLITYGTGAGQVDPTSGTFTVNLQPADKLRLAYLTVSAATSTTLTLSGGSAVDNFYTGRVFVSVVGTGAGQANVCTGYVGSTGVATFATPWVTTLNGTSTVAVTALSLAPTAAQVASAVAAPSAATIAAAVAGTGLTLAPTGLNNIPITAPTGPATNFPQMVVQGWRRWFKRATRNKVTGELKTFADDETTVLTTQTLLSGEESETQGEAA